MKNKNNMYSGNINVHDYNTPPLYPDTSGNGLWNRITTANNTIRDPYADLYARLDKLELNEKLLRLKILSLEGKFDKDEVSNIRKMLMSEDEGARTLADSIIENA